MRIEKKATTVSVATTGSYRLYRPILLVVGVFWYNCCGIFDVISREETTLMAQYHQRGHDQPQPFETLAMIEDDARHDENGENIIITENHKMMTMFQELEIEKYVSRGAVSLGFNAKWRPQGSGDHKKQEELPCLSVFVKISCNFKNTSYSSYTNNEVNILQILNQPPTIDTIPKLYWAIPSMPNPYKGRHEFITNQLGVHSKSGALRLAQQEHIGVQVVERGNHTGTPQTLDEVVAFTRSMLETLAFAHSRNVSNADLFLANTLFDRNANDNAGKAFLFDWNDGVIVEGNGTTPLRLYEMIPPEFRHTLAKNKDAKVYHPTVGAFDIWTAGKMVRNLLHDSETYQHSRHSKRRKLAMDLVDLMVQPDPYKRPAAAQLLQHSVFANG